MGGLPTQKTIYTFAYDPKDPKIMYTALRDGLFLSKDGGERWAVLDKSPKEVVAIVIHPQDSSKMFVGTGDGKVFLSKDGGYNWKLQSK